MPENLAQLDYKIRAKILETTDGYDIASALKNDTSVYTDIVHLNQQGNEVIAEAIVEKILEDKAIYKCITKASDSNKFQ